VLDGGKNFIVMSVGALTDSVFLGKLSEGAIRNRCRIYIPSGAIMGLNNLKIEQIGGIDRLMLRTTKSPKSLDISVKNRTLVFKGTSDECIKAFPKNLNISAALELV